MSFEREKKAANHLLKGIENARLTTAETYYVIEETDPALVYFIFNWLRARYRSDPAAEGVIGRIIDLCTAYPAVARKVKLGESDPLVSWFEDAYTYHELDSHEFIDLVVEKLEG